MSTAAMTFPAHTRAVLVLGLPLIGGHIANFAISLSDTVMLGWYGVEALAAVTLASSYFFVLFMFGSGFAWAVMPMVATYAAEQDEISLRRATRMGLWLSLIFAGLSMPLFIWSAAILDLMGQTPEVASQAGQYLRIAGWGIFPALLVLVIKSYLAALARTQVVLWMTVVGVVVNVLLNHALIFGNWGAPEMGVAGAAIASIGTHMAMLAGVAIYAVIRLPEHQIFVRLWRPDGEMFMRVFRLGLPIGLTSLSEVTLFSASAVMMGWLGTVALAAHGVAITLASAAFMVHLGLSNAATVRAANAAGRSDWPHLVRGAVSVAALSLAAGMATTLVFVIFPEPLIALFLEPGEPARDQIVATGVWLLAMAALFQLVDGAQVIALGLLRGVQDTRRPMVIAALSYWAVGIPCSYYLGFVAGLDGVGVWLGLVVGLACAAVLLVRRFWRMTQVAAPPHHRAA
ncbi:MAG: MATE family efflux transporter [Rhodobacteraceae bacterium]|nr:MATE family efflux transporter [Paracoccaceae bacterium]